MPPKLIILRHAEAEHNATEDYDIPDPLLTQRGFQQCKELQDHLREHCPLAKDIEQIVTSPMRRTLQTTLHALEWLIWSSIPVEIDASWQENYDGPCDTGTDLNILAAEFPGLDFSNVDPIYPDKSANTPYAFSRTANTARGRLCLQKLYSRPEKVIAVVTHSGFLRTTISKRRYDYADYRIFTFRLDNKTGELKLVEDAFTARNGGGMGRSPKGVQRVREWDFPPEDIEQPRS